MQRTFHLFLPLLFCFLFKIGNTQTLTEICDLEPTVNESSGLIRIENRLITHNDSSNDNRLYEIDTLNGNVLRSVVISNAINNDWEAICSDDAFIYIADIGNNSGSRQDLCVYKVRIDDYLSTANDTVTAETIHFKYSDQDDFTPHPSATDYDAEAMVAFGDSLYLFTKQWNDFKTRIYSLPKSVGNYTITYQLSLEMESLITDAAFNQEDSSVVLIGYRVMIGDYLYQWSTNNSSSIYPTVFRKDTLNHGNLFYQMEGIVARSKNEYYLSSEKFGTHSAKLFSYRLKDEEASIKNTDETHHFYYSNISNTLFLSDEINEFTAFSVYDSHGKKVKFGNIRTHKIHLNELKTGVYFLEITGGKQTLWHRILISGQD